MMKNVFLSYKFMLSDVVLHFCFTIEDLKIIVVGIFVGNQSPLSLSLAIRNNFVPYFLSHRQSSMNGNGIFCRRLDFSTFNRLPRHMLNSYHVKVTYF